MPGPQTSNHPVSGLAREVVPGGLDLWPRLRPVWTELLDRTCETSAFLSERWISAWIDAFGERLSTGGIVWRDATGGPVGCALISVVRGRLGPFPIRRAYLNASAAWEVGCDHNDVLALEPHAESVYDDLAGLLEEVGADEVCLVGVREPLCSALRARWPNDGWNGFVGESPYIDLDRIRASGRSYLSHLSANTRWQIRRSERLYEQRFGAPSIDVARGPDEALFWFEEMVALHEKSWADRGRPGGFRGNARTFHASLLRRAAGVRNRDELGADIVRIRFGPETIGFIYNIVYRDRVHFYQSGLRYPRDGRLKPGLVAHALSIPHYLERGASEYDFLGGEESPVQYKRSLTTALRPLCWGQLPASGPKMAVLRGARAAWRGVRGRTE